MHILSAVLLATFAVNSLGENKGQECKDTFSAKTCEFLAKHGTCVSHVKRMGILCRKTCKLCRLGEACSAIKCPYKHFCLLDSNLKAYCKCNLKCTEAQKRVGPVCGRNGKTYKTVCMMKRDECKLKKAITVYHYGNCIQQDPCKDTMPAICARLRNEGACSNAVELMQFYCPASCRLCRQPAPHPQCYFSRYGCCWNNNKRARGPNQKGCDACEEKPFCEHFRRLCSEERNISVMRQFCPKTCGYC